MMIPSEEDPKRLEVAEDGRSIGYFGENADTGRQYFPVILWGFEIESFVSSESGPNHRGLQVKVMTNSGKVFRVDWKHKELMSFKKCQEACVEQGHGDMFEYKHFDESLWKDLMTRLKFESVESGKLKYRETARNEGYQITFMREQKMKTGFVKENHIEYVTKHKVIGVHGVKDGVKEDPFHTVVETATPDLDWNKPDVELRGLKGLFEVFLPPHTSGNKEMRSSQTVILTAALVQHFYPFVMDALGECPGMMLASHEPETLKSTLSQVKVINSIFF